jgi:hypothetical protein
MHILGTRTRSENHGHFYVFQDTENFNKIRHYYHLDFQIHEL